VATAQTILDRALRLLHQIPTGGSSVGSQASEGLIALNAMMDRWRNDRLTTYALQEETVPLTASSTSKTMGATGDLVTTRPEVVLGAWILDNNISYPVRILDTREEYSSIPDKTVTSSWPDKAFYEPTYPNGTLYYHPAPDASRTMKVLTEVPVTSFAAVGTSIALPPGWEDAMAFNLAVAWAPEFETQPSPEVSRLAAETLGAIKRVSQRTLKMDSGLVGLIGRPLRANILTG
jgi:hypothetical protein